MLTLNSKVLIINKNNLKQVLFLALPIIVQGFVLQTQTIINRAFLGNLKTVYLSAIGNAVFPFNTTLAILIAISTGATIMVARNIGAKKIEGAKEYFIASLAYNTFFSLVLFVVWFFFSNIIFSLMGVDKTLIEYCTNYIRILAIFIIFFGIDTSIQATLQGIGLTKPIMYSGILKVLLGITLDWILIFGNLGFPAMGITGAALATAIANISATLLLTLYVLLSRKLPFSIKFVEILSARWGKYKDIIKIGLPTGFETFAWYIGNLVLIRFLNRIDNIAVGIYTLTYSIEILVYMVYNGIARASLTLIGQKTGEKNKNEAKQILFSCIKYDLIFISFTSVVFIIFSKQILGIFTNDSSLIEKATLFFVITSIAIFPKSINVVVGSGIRAFGDTKWMLYTQMFGTILVTSFSYIMIFIFRLNILGVYITLFTDELVRAILNTFHCFKSKKLLLMQEEENNDY